MAKKYLSLEEAAEMIGVEPGELNRLRESGELRGFADRGTFKFRVDDVEELGRRRQADSDPDVPIMNEDDAPPAGSAEPLADDEEDDLDLGEDGVSDSDVRLVLDEGLSQDIGGSDDSFTRDAGDSSPDVTLAMEGDSDSDVRLSEDPPSRGPSGDSPEASSDDSDSDVKLAEPSAQDSGPVPAVTDDEVAAGEASEGDGSEPGSDSDVRLVTDEQSPGRDADRDAAPQTVGGADESPAAPAAADASDSGIALEPPSDQAAEQDDSGIALDSGDEDSGIALESPADSGIALDDDSGVTLDSPADSGIALDSQARVAPGGAAADEDEDETQFDMATFDAESPGQAQGDDDTDTETNVMLFDEDESADDRAATVMQQSDEPPDATDFDTATDEDGPESSAELFSDDEFGSEEDLEVAADVLDEDEGLDELDVFEAGDEEFAEDFEAGETPAEFGQPAAVAAERDWGPGIFAGLTASTVLLIVCGLVMFDLVRSMWAWHEPIGVNSWLIETLGGLFGA